MPQASPTSTPSISGKIFPLALRIKIRYTLTMQGRVERGKVFRPKSSQPRPESRLLPTADTYHPPFITSPKLPEWAYYENGEDLVFPVCTVGICGDQTIITIPAIRYGTMVMQAALNEKGATDILKLHFEEQHGMKNVEDVSKFGYLLPRKSYVRP